MKPLKIGITGVRGLVGETFTPEVAVGFAQAFATYLDSAFWFAVTPDRQDPWCVRQLWPDFWLRVVRLLILASVRRPVCSRLSPGSGLKEGLP